MNKLFLVCLMMLAGSAWAEEETSKNQESEQLRLRMLVESHRSYMGLDKGYSSRLRASIKPYITFSSEELLSTQGNPVAEIEVSCDQSGKILSWKITRSSGNDAWDKAVIKAVEKTGTLPLNNGYIPPSILFSFRPRESQ